MKDVKDMLCTIDGKTCQVVEIELQRYLVLDDESFDICGEKCDVIPRECFIQTDMNEGLLNKDAMFIVNYFNEPKDNQ